MPIVKISGDVDETLCNRHFFPPIKVIGKYKLQIGRDFMGCPIYQNYTLLESDYFPENDLSEVFKIEITTHTYRNDYNTYYTTWTIKEQNGNK